MFGSTAISIDYVPLLGQEQFRHYDKPLTNDEGGEIMDACLTVLAELGPISRHIEVIKVQPERWTREDRILTYNVKITISGVKTTDKVTLEERVGWRYGQAMKPTFVRQIVNRVRSALEHHARSFDESATWWRKLIDVPEKV